MAATPKTTPYPLTNFGLQAKSHLKEFRPKMHAALQASGTLDKYAHGQQETAKRVMREMIDQGYNGEEAREVVMPRYITVPSKEEQENFGENPSATPYPSDPQTGPSPTKTAPTNQPSTNPPAVSPPAVSPLAQVLARNSRVK